MLSKANGICMCCMECHLLDICAVSDRDSSVELVVPISWPPSLIAKMLFKNCVPLLAPSVFRGCGLT